VLDDQPWTDAPPAARAAAALQGLRETGLPWTAAAARLRARVMLARAQGADLPDVADTALLDAPDWLLPWLDAVRSLADLRALDLTEALRAHLGPAAIAQMDRDFPAHVETPLGRRVPVDYADDQPAIEVRLQEMFGVTRHPMAGGIPLRITLLSPGGSPLQVTADLPGFWANSYPEVRRAMRGRYPRHPWPEDPAAAAPTTRAKPRGT
jgi:ATP-dependent helicase HrpB